MHTAINFLLLAQTKAPGLTGDLTCDEFGDCGSSFVSIAQLVTHPAVPPSTTPTQTFDSVYSTRPAS